jgi:AcrR family transcriptional regulator
MASGAQATILEAALTISAEAGPAAATVRAVAARAGVSAGLVQHYFPSKSAMREAVEEQVLALARETFATVSPSKDGEDVVDEFGRLIAAFVKDHPEAVRYVARSAFEPGSSNELFDGFVEIAQAGWAQLAGRGLLRDDLDLTWSALHIVVLNLATVLFEDAIDRQLPQPLRTDRGLERWRQATTALFRSGAYRQSERFGPG